MFGMNRDGTCNMCDRHDCVCQVPAPHEDSMTTEEVMAHVEAMAKALTEELRKRVWNGGLSEIIPAPKEEDMEVI